jgi:hypothetical protein
MLRRFLAGVALVGIAVVLPMLADAQGGRAGAARPPAAVTVKTDGVERDSSGNVVFRREMYTYPSAGRRDPFSSLIETGDIRPMMADLQIIAITVGQSDRQSIATLKDRSSDEIYRVRVGSVFGRMRVTAIRQRELTVEIDEFGYKRQETLSITVPVGGGRRP